MVNTQSHTDTSSTRAMVLRQVTHRYTYIHMHTHMHTFPHMSAVQMGSQVPSTPLTDYLA